MPETTWGLLVDIFKIAGGLGLFLYGMNLMSHGLEVMAGDRMRSVLEKATSNRFFGIGIGTAVTAVIQSSSATTVMVVGFVNAGLMNITQAIGVIMGANVGTTITAQIISFKIDPIAPLIIFIGLVVNLMIKDNRVKNAGIILIGFGMLFFGISTMGEPLKEFAKDPGFQSLLTTFEHPLLALLTGIVVTAILQSSSATTGIVITLYASGVGLDFMITAFIILGTNIGTCITAILSSLTSSRESKRAALAHVLFNVFGSVFFGTLVLLFPGILTIIQNTWPEASRQVAMFHTIFNVTTVVLLVGFVKQISKLVHMIIPEKAYESENSQRLIYLDPNIMQTPSIAVAQARRELCRMMKITRDNLELSLDAFQKKDIKKAEKVLEVENTVNFLHRNITGWLVRIRGLGLSMQDIESLGMMLHTITDIERVGDHAENIAEYVVLEKQKSMKMSAEAYDELKVLSEAAMDSVNHALETLETLNMDNLGKASIYEKRVDEIRDHCISKHIQRLEGEMCEPLAGVVYIDMVTDLERCADHAMNIAFSIKGEKV
ncbi:MAG: Na/Pi cotransporter family protein [Oscillospiraceae bacterium]|nr:Na/Pi cotransporter family protein [Oscillospiraceae bacterium]